MPLIVPILKQLLDVSEVKYTVVEREGAKTAFLVREEAVKFANFLVDLASHVGGVAWRFPQGVATYAAELHNKRGAAKARNAEKTAEDLANLKAEVSVRGNVIYFDTYTLIYMATDILNFRFMKEGLEEEVRRLVVDMVDPGKTVVWVPSRLFQRYVAHFVPKSRGEYMRLGTGYFIRIIERGILSGWDELTEEYMSPMELRFEKTHIASLSGVTVVFKIYRLGEFKRVAVAETDNPSPLAELLGVERFFARKENRVYLSANHVEALEMLGVIPPAER